MFPFISVPPSKDVIKTMYEKAHDKGIVDERFIDSVLQREEIGDTNMNEVFALPHPMELCATDTKVVVALLDTPIKWNESNSIQIVFMLVIKQGEILSICMIFLLKLSMIINWNKKL